MIDLTQIVIAVIALVGSILTAIITKHVVPVMKSKLTADERESLYTWTQIAVQTAEQLCRNGKILPEEHKKHVLDFLEKHGFTINTDEVNEMIESLVYELPPLIVKDDVKE